MDFYLCEIVSNIYVFSYYNLMEINSISEENTPLYSSNGMQIKTEYMEIKKTADSYESLSFIDVMPINIPPTY